MNDQEMVLYTQTPHQISPWQQSAHGQDYPPINCKD